ncbi:MAG: PIN domain-containing protein [Flammeovirgaceae bacterium]|nr:PIN domain-containing protein [Flammeovirgaceae bacterium]
MRIFLDANILVSVLNKEYPLFTYSSRILSLADRSEFKIFTSPLCLAIAFYFSEKKSGRKEAKRKITLLAQRIHVADTTGHTVTLAVTNHKILDFEDGLEYYSAIGEKCKCIITEDTKDFYYSEIEVLTAKDYFEKYL